METCTVQDLPEQTAVRNGSAKGLTTNGVVKGELRLNGNGVSVRDRGPSPRREHKKRDQTSRLFEDMRLATIRGNVDAVQNALHKGVSVNQTLQGGWSPLMYACSMGHPQVVQLLLQEGANPNFHKELFTPLMAACASTRENEERLLAVVDLLLSYDVDVNAVERHRISSLMFAAKEGHDRLVRRLVQHRTGCNLNLQDSQGWTALFWAVNGGRTEIVTILIDAGAKLHIKDRRGQTAFDLAVNRGLSEIAIVLGKHHALQIPQNGSLPPNTDDILRLESPLPSFLAPAPPLPGLPKIPNGKNYTQRHADELRVLLNGMALHGDTLAPPVSLSWRTPTPSPRPSPRSSPRTSPRPSRAASPAPYSNGSARPISLSPEPYYDVYDEPLKEQNFSRRARRLMRQIRHVREKNGGKKPSPVFNRNEMYSVQEAAAIIAGAERHLSVLYAAVSYVRLRLQGRPAELPLEKRTAATRSLAKLSERALVHADRLFSEIRFLNAFALQLEESDVMLPADIIVERREPLNTYTKSTIIVLVAAAAIYIWKLRWS